MYVRSKQEFQHYDSSRGTNQLVAKNLMDKLQPFVQGKCLEMPICMH